jgi:hypothetical protein
MRTTNPAKNALKSAGKSSAAAATQTLPSRLAIHLEDGDLEAWDRAYRGTGLNFGEYATDILQRTAVKPLDAQPEIYGMPQCPGREWPGNRIGVKIDEPLARAAVHTASALGVTVEDWAYSAIIAETIKFRETPVTDTRRTGPGGRPSLLDVSYETLVVAVVLTLHIPESVWQDFQNYVRGALECEWAGAKSWRDVPVLVSLGIGIPEKGKNEWDWPIDRQRNGPSRKGRIKRIRLLSKREPSVVVIEKIHENFWERIQERAAFYGITTGELCLSCICYHANLERARREKAEKKHLATLSWWRE